MSQRILSKIAPRLEASESAGDLFSELAGSIETRTLSALQDAASEYLQEIEINAAANASISKDPDQYTKVYPGYLRDTSYTQVRIRLERVEGETGFTAPYAEAHHEEPKEYRYGDMHYLRRAFDPRGFDRFMEYLSK